MRRAHRRAGRAVAHHGVPPHASPQDRVTPRLAALHFDQLALPIPTPPAGSFDPDAAARGAWSSRGAQCAGCHVPPLYTEPGWNMHTAEELGMFATLEDVVAHDQTMTRGLTTAERADLIEFLKSL